jgi:hypothetical protein
MHPYVIDRMVEERRQELYRQSRLDRHRPSRWRTQLSRRLVALAVLLGVPRPDRTTARRRLDAALGLESPC